MSICRTVIAAIVVMAALPAAAHTEGWNLWNSLGSPGRRGGGRALKHTFKFPESHAMMPATATLLPIRSDLLVTDELEVLSALVPLAGQHIIELGCGAARLARDLLARHPGSQVTGLEVDRIQHDKNLAAAPVAGLQFLSAGAQAIPLPDECFDLALMLKSLHHVPVHDMGTALAEVARVLKPGGHLYVSEPVYAGPLNRIVRLFNDEGPVRTAAQHALDQVPALHRDPPTARARAAG